MKKKIFCGLMMFWGIFILFISVSNAYEFVPYEIVSSGYKESNFKTLSASERCGDYTLGQIQVLVSSYNQNGYESSSVAADYNAMIQNLTDHGYFFWNCNNSRKPGCFRIGLFTDLGITTDSDGETINLNQGYMGIDSGGWYLYYNGSNYCYYDITANSCYSVTFSNMVMDGTCNFVNLPVKKLVYTGTNTYSWQGEYWYIPPISLVPIESEEPDFEGISDGEKASIINSIVNLDDFIDIVPKNYRNQYFIVYNAVSDNYKLYFYPEQYYLKGRKFAEGEVADVDYESYKIIAFEGSNFLWDLWQSISPFDYYVFSGSFNTEGMFSSYFSGYKDSHELNQYYFSVTDEPIVYSSRDIGFVIYDMSTGEYVEDSENSIGSTILKDSDGNNISINIPTDEGSENISFWDSIVQKIISGIKTIFIPDMTPVVNSLERLKQKILLIEQCKEKFRELLNTIETAGEKPPTITLNFGYAESSIWGSGTASVLDLSWYDKFKPSVDFIIIVFTYGFFFYRLCRILPDILNGVSSMPDIQHDMFTAQVKRAKVKESRAKKGGTNK